MTVLRRPGFVALACLLAPVLSTFGQDTSGSYKPKVENASNEGQDAIRRFRVPVGLKLELYAAEPMLANPVAFCVDEKNRFYVAETFRLHHGVTDTRNHMNWLDDDLACRTVADRVAMYRKYLGKEFDAYGREHDRVRLLEDRDGDGKADAATVFADGFYTAAEGLGSGLLARKGTVFYTDIPNLWSFRDTNGDGKADVKKPLSTGYGVHVGFLGHDLHGLRVGPDGRLYFTIGDRGLNVKTADASLFSPDMGSVLRCELDGSNLEIFATGLRNPQELAFNEHGDLFTVDNNSDGGDRARLVHLVEGGDSGWRIGWQFIESPTGRGPWNAEKMWHPQNPEQPTFLIPPLANLSDGPSGLTYYPGTGLNDSFRGAFFLCDFRGSSGNSGVRAFKARPKGASYELAENKEFLWSLEATDVDFGTDGALYVSDWVEGWNLTGKGRIYRLYDPKTIGEAPTREVGTMLAQGFDERTNDALAVLLNHPDARVRQEAQFTLADRAKSELQPPPAAQPTGSDARRAGAMRTIERAAASGSSIARSHAIWALGQVERSRAKHGTLLITLLDDREAEIRVQAARVLNDVARKPTEWQSEPGLRAKLEVALRDPEPRVRFHAALGLAKLGKQTPLDPILHLIEDNQDRDPYLRHAAVTALAGIAAPPKLAALASHPSSVVRMAGLLALRRQARPEAAKFLDDADPRVVLEAARAISDLPIVEALPQLAGLATRTKLADPLWRRVISANLQLRDAEQAKALATISSRSDVSDPIRVESLDTLSHWAKPSVRDRVTGLWHPLPDRPASEAEVALQPVLADLLKKAPDRVRVAACKAAAALKIRSVFGELDALVSDGKQPARTRVEALKALETLEDPRLAATMAKALADPESLVRAEGLRLLARLRPTEALPALERVIEHGSTVEKQAALAALGSMKDAQADDILLTRLEALRQGRVPGEIQLDLLDAAAKRSSSSIKQVLERWDQDLPKDEPLAPFRSSLLGGNAERGRKIFREHAAAECLRCHKFDGNGGEVGPELAGIGKRQSREYILESMVVPNKQIAQGFETTVLGKTDGTIVQGILKGEDAKELRLITAEGKLVTVPKSEVEERRRGSSAMPEDTVKKLSKSELRDLVEFLSGSK
jgi:quinoprotein glucose dehydrogenase